MNIKKISIVVLLFIFTFVLRLWNLNQMGATWDESAQVVDGYHFIEILAHGDFNNKYLYDHPTHPPLTKYIYGLSGHLDATSKINPHPIYRKGEPIFNYDLTYSHITSILFASLSVIPVVLIGWEYISPFVGTIAGIIFSMLPFFVGLSQVASIESILMFFFTISVYLFLKFLKHQTMTLTIITAVLTGLALGTKYTNFLLFPLMIWIYLIWYFHHRKKKKKLFNVQLIYIFFISLITYFVIWPQPWFHLNEFIQMNYEARIVDTKYSVPEIFFGRLMFVPKVYYIVHFLITTPFLILGLLLVGLKNISDKKGWVLYMLAAWFVLPFIQSFYNFRQHGVRYIIEIYAPLSLIVAIGFDFIASKLTKKILIKSAYFVPVFIYMLVILVKTTPYYLDYFNIVVGGAKGVYEKRLFQLGWWGEGIKEAAIYIDQKALRGSRVAFAVDPIGTVPPLKNVIPLPYDPKERYDYAVVNYFNVTRERFDDSEIRRDYKLTHEVRVDGGVLIWIYKHK